MIKTWHPRGRRSRRRESHGRGRLEPHRGDVTPRNSSRPAQLEPQLDGDCSERDVPGGASPREANGESAADSPRAAQHDRSAEWLT
jgi:hypothetical protein